MKLRLLDLFAGAGGAAVGYHRAGFEVVGVDIVEQPRYPFDFLQADALAVLRDGALVWEDGDLSGYSVREFDAIHASPPCQAYSKAQQIRQNEHPDLIAPLRELLKATGLPYVIENVRGAPLLNPAQLEGQMFPELRTHRPRWFETNWPLEVPFMRLSPPPNAKMGRRPKGDEWPQLVGHFPDVEGGRKAMGTPWMTRDEMAEAIPPAYSEFVGAQLLQHLKVAA